MSQRPPIDRARLLRKLPKLRQAAQSLGLDAVRTLDSDRFPEEILPLIPYAELFAGDWDDVDVIERLDLAAPELKQQLAALREEYRDEMSEWLRANVRQPARRWEQLAQAERERIWNSYPKHKGYSAHWAEQQSTAYHAMSRLLEACDRAHYELHPPAWVKRERVK